MNNDLPRLGQPAVRALRNAGITNLQQLTQYKESEISQLHGIGRNALKQLSEALEQKGLTFKR
ncbi:DNA-directed RNA polymerase subunit alpha C-terminal domain-containing protein [Cohnella terricola]|uniref:DNA-binding protein n=1 Tax=Cohnella terricola TaxID=1289167 RepID=A0A559J8S8_9BACL|nr:DNA-directed RNA polymerase subunit alpha C-terminal domain-containing protein [Cohnella terricola]TVX96299.1 DNA-binding protein [Cohnella terricola]